MMGAIGQAAWSISNDPFLEGTDQPVEIAFNAYWAPTGYCCQELDCPKRAWHACDFEGKALFGILSFQGCQKQFCIRHGHLDIGIVAGNYVDADGHVQRQKKMMQGYCCADPDCKARYDAFTSQRCMGLCVGFLLLMATIFGIVFTVSES